MKRLFEGGRICEEFSPGYYGVCAVGGLLSAGTTHLAITPLDVLKVNMQVNPVKYNSISGCFTSILREQGPSAFWRGSGGKFFGYGIQGACRFGLYEYFKKVYSNLLVDQNRSFVFFISSASAEVIANLALCPFEAIKVRVQAQPHFAKGLVDGVPKLYASEGLRGFYRGLVPLWGRNLPFSMVMFSTFEHSVNFIYRNVLQRRKEDCSRTQQLGVTCFAGYAAGSVGSIVSNPADNIVACLYNKRAKSLNLAVKKIGLVNLFTRSLPIRIMLVGPSVTLQWFFYDTIKVLSGFMLGYHPYCNGRVADVSQLAETFAPMIWKKVEHPKLIELKFKQLSATPEHKTRKEINMFPLQLSSNSGGLISSDFVRQPDDFVV